MQDPSFVFGEYHAVPFSLDHYSSMAVLFLSAFEMNLTRDHFLKRYDTASAGSPVVGYIALHKPSNTPAAYYGVFPVWIEWKGKSMLAAQSGDTMTHAEHRKKGLFIWLAQLTYEACRKNSISVVFGLPNKNSYHGFINRLNWKEIGSINRYDLKLHFKTIPLGKWFAGTGKKHFYHKWCRWVMNKLIIPSPSTFHNPLSTNYARIIRSQEYLKYKSDRDKYFIQLGDTILWVKCADLLWIGEVSNYGALDKRKLGKLKKLAFLLGYNTISFHLNAELAQPGFLRYFRKYEDEPSCFIDLAGSFSDFRILLTAADFDTW